MARVRVHQHVNPLSPYYTQEPEPVDPTAVFSDPSLPLHLDIGCARGRFLLKMAAEAPKWNYLGVEIREPLVIEANELKADEGLTNLHYKFCNAMLWLDRLLEKVPTELLQMITIQFPDPWFKKKHSKRRMVNQQLVADIIARMAIGGRLFVQTDIEFLAEEMFLLFRSESTLAEIEIVDNPFPVRTEREIAVRDKSLPIFRAMFEKMAN